MYIIIKNMSKSEIKLGGKINDTRVIVGGEVQSKAPGKELFVIALDYSAQYPAQIEANNISMSTRVDKRIIENPQLYGLKIIKEKTIRDCYNTRKIYWITSNKEDNENNKIYRVEEFKCEFKLDIDLIKKNLDVINTTLKSDENHINAINNIKELYPEINIKNNELYLPDSDIILTHTNIPKTIIKSVYFVQSNKAEDGWTNEHLSLNEIMLTDLRFKRNAVKKQMSNAFKTGDEFNGIRYNSKQLAIKVVCNSTYGASGSPFYAYYDPVIGATITWCAREMIHDLTYVLESNKIYVDEQFIKDNQKQYNKLIKYGVIKNVINISSLSDIENNHSLNDNNENLLNNIALSLRRLYNEEWEPIGKFIKLELNPAKIIYQDTDSNYYVIRYLQEKFKDNHTPHDINKIMHIMKKHNEFFQSFMSLSIFRPPIGLGFEAAKIIARYFNVKKRYYGIEWNPDMTDKLSEDAYENDILKNNYNEYWQPGKTTLPLEDGSYLKVSEELLNKNIDFVNYMHHNNLSVTGMPLTRRDSYRFANYLNLIVYKEDLSLSRYIGNNKWENCLKTNLEDIIIKVLNSFKEQINKISVLVTDGLNNIDNPFYELPKPFFRLKDYSQQVQNKPDKKNDIMQKIKERYEKNNRKPIEIFERVNFVAINTPEVKELISKGRASLGNVSEFAFTIDELMDEYHEKLPLEEYNKLYISDYISYDDFIECYIINNLCFRHYFKALCSTLSSFAVEYMYEKEIKNARDNIMDKEERKKIIKDLTDDAADQLLQIYFPYGREYNKHVALKKSSLKIPNKMTSKGVIKAKEFIDEIYPKFSYEENINKFKEQITNNYNETKEYIDNLLYVLDSYKYDKFNIFLPKNTTQKHIYNGIIKNKDKFEYYTEKLNKYYELTQKYEYILSQMT